MNAAASLSSLAAPPPRSPRALAASRALGRVRGAPSSAAAAAATSSLGRLADSHGAAARRHAAEQMVSQMFFVPLLAEMRKSPFGGEIGNGGRMEEAFSEQLDLRIADHVAAADTGGLTTQIEARIGRGHGLDLGAIQPDWATRLRVQAAADAALGQESGD